eukprot:TRINITY_DN14126_c0_g1_i1.p1 TRINITY_DN14126_c0_g1~~TRINITY_DN14126_c0_g1_i1.p1  ORF type:complete len:331 (-),score=50.67 TRINITY_DN14126_c0_g1_i1:123-1115(-)
MAYQDKSDKVIKEGWWKKVGGKGYYVDKKIPKNQYIILTDQYLDWYSRPGDKRLGCIQLNSLYVRIHADQMSLVIGNTMRNGKEFRLSTEGGDAQGRLTEWYKAITQAIDDFRDKKRDGGHKVVVREGADKRPEVAVPGKTSYLVSETTAPAAPPVTVVSQTAPVVSQTVPVTGMAANQYRNAAPAVTVVNQQPAAPQVVHQTVVHPPAQTVVHPPAQTIVHPPAQTVVVQAPAPSPMMTYVTQQPTYVTQQPTYVTQQPAYVTSHQPAAVHLTTMPTQMINCGFCRQVFQQPPGSQTFACPFCRQVNQINQAPATVMMTTTYNAPPVFM